MSYLDHLYQPIQEDTLNEISADFIAHRLNNAMGKVKTKFASAQNALQSRNKAFKGVPNYKINRNSPAWTMPTKHYQASMDYHDKMLNKYKRVQDKAYMHLGRNMKDGTLGGFKALSQAQQRDRDNRN